MMFGEEKCRADTGSASSNAAKDERPAEPVICIARHPLISITEDRKNYHAETGANASAKQEVCGDLKCKIVKE